jgi:hypothetical protein
VKLYHQERGIQIYHGDSLAEPLPGMCDLLCVDAPYSARTHARCNADVIASTNDNAKRRALDYVSWGASQVRAAIRTGHDWSRTQRRDHR